MIHKIKYFFLFLILMAVACRSNKDTIPRNLDMIYNPLRSSIHPEYRVYNTSDSTSVIAGRIKNSELLYNQANDENKLLARLQVEYNLYDLNKKERLIDSSLLVFSYEKNPEINYRYVEIPFNSINGDNFILEIITTDLNRKSRQFSFLHVKRSKEKDLQDFMLRNRFNQKLITKNAYNSDTLFEITYYNHKIDSLNVFYFKSDYDIPKPPEEIDNQEYNFTEFDSVWVEYPDSLKYEHFNNEGLYYFTKKDKPICGFTLLNFGSEFPKIKTPKELLEPLEYLGIKDTLTADSTGRYRKLLVDNFWLERANNIDKSRDLLQKFYNRVMFANLYFTSFMEGWKTDRGMIYIIYGQPDYVFKSDEEERWIYDPIDLGPGYNFIFKYYENPFSLNHFILDREKAKSTGWSEAINIWISGEVNYYQN